MTPGLWGDGPGGVGSADARIDRAALGDWARRLASVMGEKGIGATWTVAPTPGDPIATVVAALAGLALGARVGSAHFEEGARADAGGDGAATDDAGSDDHGSRVRWVVPDVSALAVVRASPAALPENPTGSAGAAAGVAGDPDAPLAWAHAERLVAPLAPGRICLLISDDPDELVRTAFTTLLAGAELVVVGMDMPPDELTDLVDDLGVEVLRGTPDALRGLPAVRADALARWEIRDQPSHRPAAAAHRQMWTLQHLDPGSAAYTVGAAWRADADLDVACLRDAFEALQRRHPALRTTLVERSDAGAASGTPSLDAVVWPDSRTVLVVEDLPDADAVLAVRRGLGSEVFDLAGPTLVRGWLRRSPEATEIHLALHHAICDEWSLNVLSRDLAELYAARRDGRPATLPRLQPRRGDIAVTDPKAGEAALAGPDVPSPAGAAGHAAEPTGADTDPGYWAEALAQAPPELRLPTDRPEAEARGEIAGYPLDVGPDVNEAIDRLRARGYSPFQGMLAATGLAFGRASGQEDLVVGSVITQRTATEDADTVGMFVSTVPLRLRPESDIPVRDYLDATRGTILDALDHADVPFEEIVRRVRPARVGSHPIFQQMVVLSPLATVAEGAGMRWTPVIVPSGGARFPLTLFVVDAPGQLTGRVDYDPDLFDEATIARLAADVGRALVALAGDGAETIGELDWGTTVPDGTDAPDRPEWREEGSADEAFAALAATRPGLLALRELTRDSRVVRDWSYADLAARAAAIADAARAAGVRPGDVLASLVVAGGDAIAALVAAQFAGAAWCPIDPSLPSAEVESMVRLSGARAVLVADAGADEHREPPRVALDDLRVLRSVPDPTSNDPTPSGAPSRVTTTGAGFGDSSGVVPPLTDGEAAALRHPDGGAVARVAGRGPYPGELPAYVLFTSGSTGTPKGVVVTRAGLANLARAFVDRHDLRSGERLLALPPLIFDAFQGDVWPALISGGALVVHSDPVELTAATLMDAVAAHQISSVDAASPHWQRWVEQLADDQTLTVPHVLTRMMVGGESVPVRHARAWVERAPAAALYNHYGPTEGTVCATVHEVSSAAAGPDPLLSPGSDVAIGRALPNTRVYVLDRRLRPVPPGVVGELCIGGDGVASGYLDRPGATAAAFVPDPYAGRPGARMYRTGDLGHRDNHGRLHFAGRRDGQVKIRGRRIELGAVEAAVSRCPGVLSVAVSAPYAPDGQRHLVAYVVPRPGEAAQPRSADGDGEFIATCRADLLGRVAAHLVPAAFVILDALPLTRQGKTDRTRLPAPDPAVFAAEYVAPAGPTEETIARVWSQVLGVDRVGAQDNFDDLGGHSLAAAVIVSRLNILLDSQVGVRDLLAAGTVAAAALLYEGSATPGDPSTGPSLPQADNGSPSAPPTAEPTADSPGHDGIAGTATTPGAGEPGGDSRALAPAATTGDTADLMRADARPPADLLALTASQGPRADRVRVVTLTGATGFLGAHLLGSLLAGGAEDVRCLVRAGDDAEAMRRVLSAVETHGAPIPASALERVQALAGDVEAPGLGLSDERRRELAAATDAVVHCASRVNFVEPYRELRGNVAGTVEALRLAAAAGQVGVHVVSTLGVFLTPDLAGTTVTEVTPLPDPGRLADGYAQSKWVADALADAVRRSLPVAIHRPARVVGHSATGVGSPGDYFSGLLAACAELGLVPDLPGREDLAPVDIVAAAIAADVLRRPDPAASQPHTERAPASPLTPQAGAHGARAPGPTAACGTWHYRNPATIDYPGIAEGLRVAGFAADVVPYSRWWTAVRAAVAEGGLASFSAYASLLRHPDTPRAGRAEFDASVTTARLHADGLAYPPADPGLIARLVAALPVAAAAAGGTR